VGQINSFWRNSRARRVRRGYNERNPNKQGIRYKIYLQLFETGKTGEMNMKRSLLMSLFAIAVVAMTFSQAMATVNLQLNLRYDDPNNESAGGSWDLLAQTDATEGIAGLSVNASGIDSTITDNNGTTGWNISENQVLGNGDVEIVLGYDLSGVGPTVGTPGGPGNVATDDLGNSAWNNSALLASGTFGGTRPVITFGEANEFSSGSATQATISDPMRVRGDSVATDGLIKGDANRSGKVDATDFSILASPANFGKPGGWDQGDFNSDGMVNATDFSILASPANFGKSWTPPAVTAVPEPTSLVMAAFALVGFAGRRRR
jgi:hypothetical protein